MPQSDELLSTFRDIGGVSSASVKGILEGTENGQDMDASWTSKKNVVIISVCYAEGKIGAAVYDQSCTTVRLLRDVGEEYHFPVLASLLEQVDPTLILANRGQDVNMLNFLSRACGNDVAEDDATLTENNTTMNTTVDASRFENNGGSNSEAPNKWTPKTVTVSDDSTRKSPLNARDGEMEGGEIIGDDEPGEEREVDESRRDENTNNDEEEYDERADSVPSIDATVTLLSNFAYNCEKSLARISELFSSESMSECENELITRFRIDTLSINMVRALGALLVYMDNARTGVEFDLPSVRTPVSAIRTLLVQEMVEMDAMSFRALDIFTEEAGADVTVRSQEHARSVRSDRLSVFGLCCRCQSAPGKRMLRKWFERPTRDLALLNARQEAISFLLRDSSADIVQYIHRNLRPIRSLRSTIKRLRASNMRCADWAGIHATCYHLRALGQALHSGRCALDIMRPFMNNFNHRLAETCNILAILIDYGESRVENRMVVNEGVDPDLDQMKAVYRALPARLTDEARYEASRLEAPSCAVGYVPMLGYLLKLPADYDIEAVDDLSFLYKEDDFMHVKSERMLILDQEIGDIKMHIIDRETTIMLRLERQILARGRQLLKCVEGAATLDCCLSLAQTARLFNWCRPALVPEPVIDATKVVHPLATLTVDRDFVSNPIRSSEEQRKVKIFTGPNACGKSLYLKQVGVLCYLAHVGSYVPAAGATIGLLSGIFTRMYTVDGVLDGMSTFTKDLGQLSLALRRASSSSLVIIDEFGKGTMTEVGLSLLTASIEHLTRNGASGCPHLLVSTHFHALLDLLQTDPDLITYQTLEVIRRGSKLDFQYRLVEGVVNSSFAAFTAAKEGIPSNVVATARRVYDHLRDGGSISEIRTADEQEDDRNDFLVAQMEEALEWIQGWTMEDRPGGEGDNVPDDVMAVVQELAERLMTPREKRIIRGEEEENEKDTEGIEKEPGEEGEVEVVAQGSQEENDDPEERNKAVEQITFDSRTDSTVVSIGSGHEKRGSSLEVITVESQSQSRPPASLHRDSPSSQVSQVHNLRRTAEENSRSQSRHSQYSVEIIEKLSSQRGSQFLVSRPSQKEGEQLGATEDNRLDWTFPWEHEDEDDSGEFSQTIERILDDLKDVGKGGTDNETRNTHTSTRSLQRSLDSTRVLDASVCSERGGILKSSRPSNDRSERSNLSVSFSTAVTMLMGKADAVEEAAPSEKTRNEDAKGNWMMEDLFNGSTRSWDGGGIREKRSGEGGLTKWAGGKARRRDDTEALTIAVKRLRSH